MIDDGMFLVQEILRQQIYSYLITNQKEFPHVVLPPELKTLLLTQCLHCAVLD